MQARVTSDDSRTYFFQTLGQDGRVFSQYQMDDWTHRQKVKQAMSSGTGHREMIDDIITFAYRNCHVRCHSLLGAEFGNEPLLIVEVEGSGTASSLPSWLKPMDVPKDHPALSVHL